MKTFSELADAIEKIQSRPRMERSIPGIILPSFSPNEYKVLALSAIQPYIVGAASAAGGVAAGVAFMGVGVLAVDFGAVAGGLVFCVMANNMRKKQ